MTGRTPERLNQNLNLDRNLKLSRLDLSQSQKLKVVDLSSKTLRLSPEDFSLDDQSRIVIDRGRLAEAIQSKLLKEGEPNLSGSATEVEVAVKVKF